MIEETAVVVKCEGEFAWVETQRKNACGHCSVNKSCGTGTIAKIWGQKPSPRMKAINEAHASEGETVLVGLQEGALVQGSLIIYLMPIVSMILFAIFGKYMAPQWQLAPETTSILFAVIGFVFAGILIKIYSRQISADARYQPIVLKRLSTN